MPYVKSISIKTTVNKSIAYILNPEKTEDLLYATGINCIAERTVAYNQFCGIYKHYNEQLYKGVKGKKSPIKAHHFIQSFKEGDVTPELAHKIAKEWAEKVFGDDRQIVIATHLDKGHIHSHFIVNAIDYNGKKYYGNKTTMLQARDISDQICQGYGIECIKGKTRCNMGYKEWMEKKQGRSWKHNIRLAIDKAVIRANNLDELLNDLRRDGYEIKRGKYISIKAKENDRYVRTKTLGEDYTEDNLILRMKEKYKELKILEIQDVVKTTKLKKQNSQQYTKQNYQGIQLKYVSMIRLLAELIMQQKKPVRKHNSRKPYSKENDYDINQLANQLQILNRENITSEDQLVARFSDTSLDLKIAKSEIEELTEKSENIRGIILNACTFFDLQGKKSLSGSDTLKLTLAQSLIGDSRIRTKEDLACYKKELEEMESRRKELIERYKVLETRYREFKILIETYKAIQDERYLKQVQKTKQEKQRDDKSR